MSRFIDYNGNNFSGNASDTTYKLKDQTIEAFNKLFDGKTPLKSHLVTTKFHEGHYAGQYECIYYTDLNGKTDHLLFILSYLDPEMLNFIDKVIYYLPFSGERTKAPYHHLAIENKIAEWYKACNCMPPIEQPPTMMSTPPGAGK
jgi:hypothetical protein